MSGFYTVFAAALLLIGASPARGENYRFFQLDVPNRESQWGRVYVPADEALNRKNPYLPLMVVRAVFQTLPPKEGEPRIDALMNFALNMHLPENANRASEWSSRRHQQFFPQFETYLKDPQKRIGLDKHTTMIYAHPGGYRDNEDIIGTLKVIFPDENGEIPFYKNLGGFNYEPAPFSDKEHPLVSSYPLFDVASGQFKAIPLNQGRKVGKPAQLAEINSVGSTEATTALFLSAAIEVARRAQDPHFELPSEYVLHCPKENIAIYAGEPYKFTLIQDEPIANGLYGMRISPEGFARIGVGHSHRKSANILRRIGYELTGYGFGTGDTSLYQWLGEQGVRNASKEIKDRRASFWERLSHRVKRTWRHGSERRSAPARRP